MQRMAYRICSLANPRNRLPRASEGRSRRQPNPLKQIRHVLTSESAICNGSQTHEKHQQIGKSGVRVVVKRNVHTQDMRHALCSSPVRPSFLLTVCFVSLALHLCCRDRSLRRLWMTAGPSERSRDASRTHDSASSARRRQLRDHPLPIPTNRHRRSTTPSSERGGAVKIIDAVD
jgi:hypothetical protein